MIKIVFSDVDGTLLDGIRGIPIMSDKNQYAIRTLLNRGVYVVISSGRSKSILNKELMNLNLSGLILCNGSYVELFNEPIQKIIFSNEQVKYIEDCTLKNNGISLYENQNGLYACKYDNSLGHFEKQWNMPLLKVQRKDKMDEEIYKILSVFKNELDCENFALTVDDSMDIRKQKGILAYDVSPKGINKGSAIQMVLDKLNISNSDAIAFGDNINDMEMLKTVGMGIAMANAHEKLKETADDVALDVLEDGFYYWLVKHNVIDKMEKDNV